VGSIGYQSSPCTPHLCDTDHQIVSLYFDDMIWGEDEKAGRLLALTWAEMVQFLGAYVKKCCSKANAMLQLPRLHVLLRALHVQP